MVRSDDSELNQWITKRVGTVRAIVSIFNSDGTLRIVRCWAIPSGARGSDPGGRTGRKEN